MPLITLQITPDIATKIRALAEAGVFAIKTGNATINFLDDTIKSIKTEYYTYPKVDNQVDVPEIVAIVK
jgi:hypothetical protein